MLERDKVSSKSMKNDKTNAEEKANSKMHI
jgi:hypothetical protein